MTNQKQNPIEGENTAYAVVYKKDLPELDGEAKKGVVHSLHIFKRTADMVRHPQKHTVKKVKYEFIN